MQLNPVAPDEIRRTNYNIIENNNFIMQYKSKTASRTMILLIYTTLASLGVL